MSFNQARGGAREPFSLRNPEFFGYERPSDAHSATQCKDRVKWMAAMDAPGSKLSAGTLMYVQDGSTDELWSHYGEKFLKNSIFQNFQIAILAPLAPTSVEYGHIG